MTTLDFGMIKNIPQRDKDAIYGYIREMQARFPKDNTFYNIPESINYICALFYFLKDKWDPKYIGQDHTLSDDGYSITTKGGQGSSSYGTDIAKSPGIYRWKFKIQELPKYMFSWSLVIGVWKVKSANKQVTDTYFTNCTQNQGEYEWGYAYDISYTQLVEKTGHYSNQRKYGLKIKIGDIVEMILDLNLFTLRYKINDEDMGIAFENIEDTEYKAAFSSGNSDVRIEILR